MLIAGNVVGVKGLDGLRARAEKLNGSRAGPFDLIFTSIRLLEGEKLGESR